MIPTDSNVKRKIDPLRSLPYAVLGSTVAMISAAAV
jgi:hypothetical protein